MLVLDRQVTIIGEGSGEGEDAVVLHGSLTARILLVEPEASGSVLENIELRGGLAWTGGAIYQRAGSLRLADCSLAENVAQCNGGAIYAERGTLSLAGCVFDSNRAGERGGGIHLVDGTAQLSGCSLVGDDAAAGGALYLGAGAQGQLTSCLIVDGSADRGGWACVEDGFLTARQSTFFGLPGEPESGGIVLRGELGSAFIETSILCFAGAPALAGLRDGAAMLVCCNVYGNRGGDWTGMLAAQAEQGGNLSANPAFCGLHRGNFGLDPRSPCAPANNPCGELIGALDVGCTECLPEDATAARSSN
jgi:predicted outer membrane repeat protein